ncbi:CDP-diacylglycerol--serine O-phosphatidyltransferase [candidate division KSB3 bacterium]|uniref:CDP-diacylglycerol--serine O-phosphatidyltransferase n=1 Tax=candidate division KSB3 bacterium TaxID=2044937 RepID=A0A9D5JTA7_9BACT|nr:CDP-diacylglycerol--serine O-phosphatidyltransferase [candidate division KSB3 bacterium]MBD3323837.1 CDP-diacylglycerol--serine O-phosphatidyltransferase [candidate division KSB3 bacterium]
MKKIYLLPNFFTLGNIFFGFYSIVSSINAQFTQAAYVIIVAGFFDVFDGKIARATNSTSRFGVEFDSLADLVSFGVAPGLLVYLWALKPLGRIGWLGAFLFLVCGALRLARFNVQVGEVSSDRFVGLPIPCAAGMLATTVIFFEHYAEALAPTEKYLALITILVYLLGVLMVSNVKYRSAKNISPKGKSPFKIMVVASLILIIIALKPEITFFLISMGYVTFGLLEAVPGFNKLLVSLQAKYHHHEDREDGASL